MARTKTPARAEGAPSASPRPQLGWLKLSEVERSEIKNEAAGDFDRIAEKADRSE
ncbi:MAG: hypothetical protein Q8L48_19580 [Archangium sp.]|nr:hypothetical protein [Archangium sp.]